MVGGGKDMEEMSKLINIDDERFLDILFDEACVDGKQAERIKAELDKIVAFDTEKVVEQLDDYLFDKYCVEGDSKIYEIVKEGGVDAGGI